MNTPNVDNKPVSMDQEKLETQTSVGSQTQAAPDVQAALAQISADIKSMTSPAVPLAALEAKVNSLTEELAKVKAYSETLNQRYIALEASRGTPTGVKTDHRCELDKNAACRQRVNETIAAIKAKRDIPN